MGLGRALGIKTTADLWYSKLKGFEWTVTDNKLDRTVFCKLTVTAAGCYSFLEPNIIPTNKQLLILFFSMKSQTVNTLGFVAILSVTISCLLL